MAYTFSHIEQGLNVYSADLDEAERLKQIAVDAVKAADDYASALAEKHATLVTNVTEFLDVNKDDALTPVLASRLTHLNTQRETTAADVKAKRDVVTAEVAVVERV